MKCYLVGNRKCFTSISLEGLTEKFDLPLHTVRKLVCKWIYNRDLKGSITSDLYLQIAQKKRTDLQKVSEDLFSKLEEVRKANENIYENRIGSYADDEDYDKEVKVQRKTNAAMSEKLQNILSKRS